MVARSRGEWLRLLGLLLSLAIAGAIWLQNRSEDDPIGRTEREAKILHRCRMHFPASDTLWALMKLSLASAPLAAFATVSYGRSARRGRALERVAALVLALAAFAILFWSVRVAAVVLGRC